jgi:hypothetical protein
MSSLLRIMFLAASALSALCAFVAAWYWFLSSRPTPQISEPPSASVEDVPALHILDAQVNTYKIQEALVEASRLNRNAAIWSACAALFGGIAASLSVL